MQLDNQLRKRSANNASGTILGRLRDQCFDLFAAINLCPATRADRTAASAFTVIQGLQLLSFALSSTVGFPWTRNYIWPVSAVVKIARFDLYITKEESIAPPMAVIAVIFAIVSGLGIAAILLLRQLQAVALRRSSGDVDSSGELNVNRGSAVRSFANSSILLKAFARVLAVCSTVLAIPITALLMGAMQCGSDLQSVCWTGMNLVRAILASTALIMWLPMWFAYCTFQFAREMTLVSAADTSSSAPSQSLLRRTAKSLQCPSDNCLEQAERRTAVVQQLVILLLIVVYGEVSNQIGSGTRGWVLALLYFTAMTALLGMHWYYMPIVNSMVQAIQVAVLAALMWSGVCAILTLVYDNPDQVVASVSFLLGAPVVMCLAVLCLQHRRLWLTNLDLTEVEAVDHTLLALWARFQLQSIQEHKDGRSSSSDTDSKDTAQQAQLARRVLDRLTTAWAADGHVNPVVTVQIARLYASWPDPFQRQRVAMFIAASAEKRPALDVQFSLFCLQQCVDESLDEDLAAVQANRYILHHSLVDQANSAVVVAARSQQAFFAELASGEVVEDHLITIGKVSTYTTRDASGMVH